MKSKAPSLAGPITLVFLVIFASGCGQSEFGYMGHNTAAYENTGSDNVYITQMRFYQDRGDLVVVGRAKRGYNFCCDAARGHVDIAVQDVNGVILGTASTFYRPRNIPKARTRSSSFKVRLPIILPEGAAVQAAYHDASKATMFTSADGILQCELNAALLEYQAKAPDESHTF
ncbi:MAG: hypothetical protein ACYS4W_06430 [Planctomycetota bacterium]|jgi:hypothetical protein